MLRRVFFVFFLSFSLRRQGGGTGVTSRDGAPLSGAYHNTWPESGAYSIAMLAALRADGTDSASNLYR